MVYLCHLLCIGNILRKNKKLKRLKKLKDNFLNSNQIYRHTVYITTIRNCCRHLYHFIICSLRENSDVLFFCLTEKSVQTLLVKIIKRFKKQKKLSNLLKTRLCMQALNVYYSFIILLCMIHIWCSETMIFIHIKKLIILSLFFKQMILDNFH